MSFDYNPFKHIEIIEHPKVNGLHQYGWYCHSCGADSKTKFKPSDTIREIFYSYTDHVKDSHGMTKKDVKGWSKY